jgi:hypothetical protein
MEVVQIEKWKREENTRHRQNVKPKWQINK